MSKKKPTNPSSFFIKLTHASTFLYGKNCFLERIRPIVRSSADGSIGIIEEKDRQLYLLSDRQVMYMPDRCMYHLSMGCRHSNIIMIFAKMCEKCMKKIVECNLRSKFVHSRKSLV